MASPPCCGKADCAASRPVVTAAGQVIDDAMRAFGALLTAGIAGGHSRFGRGRGKGTARRSTTMAGPRKATIGSLGRDLRTAAALGIEPVISSLAGACLPLLVAFRMAKSPNTRIATTAMPSRVGRLGVSQGTTKKCPIVEHRRPRRCNFRLKGSGNRKSTMLVPNSLLEIGGLGVQMILSKVERANR